MGSIIKTKALILNSIRWKESSKIVTIYGAQTGRLKIIARGALRNNNSFAGKLETLYLAELLIDSRNSRTLQILKEIDVLNTFQKCRLDFNIFPYALSVLEIVNQICEETQADEVFFNFILTIIESINETNKPENIIIYFLLKLASYLGFKPALQHCTSGNFEHCDHRVFLSITDGSIFCKNCIIESKNLLVLTKDQYFYLKNLQNINHRRIKDVVISRDDFAQLIQIVVRYINFHLERTLNIEALQLLGR